LRWRLREEAVMLEMRLVGRESESRIAMTVLWREERVEWRAPTGWIVGGVSVSR
jgi:hypothetical protein